LGVVRAWRGGRPGSGDRVCGRQAKRKKTRKGVCKRIGAYEEGTTSCPLLLLLTDALQTSPCRSFLFWRSWYRKLTDNWQDPFSERSLVEVRPRPVKQQCLPNAQNRQASKAKGHAEASKTTKTSTQKQVSDYLQRGGCGVALSENGGDEAQRDKEASLRMGIRERNCIFAQKKKPQSERVRKMRETERHNG
jgi:hypothetical protein